MRLHFTSGYHPEGDGQTEHANQVLEQYLRGYMNYQQDNWATLLPMAEFAYNNATNATTGVSPFFANKGYHLEITLDPQAKHHQPKHRHSWPIWNTSRRRRGIGRMQTNTGQRRPN